MSFASRNTKENPGGRDSKDVAKLRREYEAKAKEARDSRDPASAAKLRDDKQKMFQRVVEQISAERKDSLGDAHRALASMGRYKSDAQLKEEQARADAAKQQQTRK